MKAIKERDKIKSSKVYFFEEKRKCLKVLKHNKKCNALWWSRHKLSSLPFKTVKTRCIITGRGNAVNKTFKLSRHELSRWASMQILPGLFKASW